MSEFSLSVAADDFSPECGLKEELLLFWIAEVSQHVEEHDTMERKGHSVAEDNRFDDLVAAI